MLIRTGDDSGTIAGITCWYNLLRAAVESEDDVEDLRLDGDG